VSPCWNDVACHDYKSVVRFSRLSDIVHNQSPTGRVGRPEDVVETSLFRSGDEGFFVTGVNLVIDGGTIRKMIHVE
jgi:NAD(P)-dependent dehydrogenase (short-subunit alcohol dehydrogenase family)